jgi:hypothetical protein
MHPLHIPIDYQLQLALDKRDAQLRRSLLRQYLAQTTTKPSLSFRMRAFTSGLLFSAARNIKPCRPTHAPDLWVPETQTAS